MRQALSSSLTLPWTAAGIWLAGESAPAAIQSLQFQRLHDLVSFARRHSLLYRELYKRLPDTIEDPRCLPPLEKRPMMDRFDEWVTDPRVTLSSVERFLRERPVGDYLLGDYAVWKTSGTSGDVGYFLHDREALQVYDLLFGIRGWSQWVGPGGAWAMGAKGFRLACVTATEDHFAGISSWRRLADDNGWLASHMRDFSVMMPLPDLVEALNEWQPAQLVAYPSVLSQLRHEQEASRLRIDPVLLIAGGEVLDPVEKGLIESTFGAPVRGVYVCSECDYIGFGCCEGWLHVNSDWMILEPVDASFQPVSPGEASHSCLVTNLANRVQPVLRYELCDSIMVRPDPCPCGSPFPAIQVEGRRAQVLNFLDPEGKQVSVLPMAITTVLDVIPGLRRFQIVQVGRNEIAVRYDLERTCDPNATLQSIKTGLRKYLHRQRLPDVRIRLDPHAPHCDPRSGKFHQVEALHA